MKNAYGQLKIGNPLDANNHVGPLIDKNATQDYLNAIEKAKKEGGKILVGGSRVKQKGFFVEPTLIENLSFQSRTNEGTLPGTPCPVFPLTG